MTRLGLFRGIEHRMESLFEGVFGRAFRSHVQPVELARKLAKEMDDHRTVSVSRVYVPNEYVLYLSPRDRAQFVGYERSLLDELSGYLAEHARREGYSVVSAPRVLLEEDADLAVGEFGIATRLVQPPPQPAAVSPPPPTRPVAAPAPPPPAPVSSPAPAAAPLAPPVPESAEPGETRVYRSEQPVPPAVPPAPAPERVFLVGGGARHELLGAIAVIGRSKECDVSLDDASVSRRHAEVRAGPDGYWIADLGSTNGTEVNGKRVDRVRLAPGDVVTLGQTVLRFEHAPGG
ncbi:MAG: FHA domain-containing protein [Thermoleophilia bacterium]|nr:FHA domain-containing protein [Thermoleophilia bacterium]